MVYTMSKCVCLVKTKSGRSVNLLFCSFSNFYKSSTIWRKKRSREKKEKHDRIMDRFGEMSSLHANLSTSRRVIVRYYDIVLTSIKNVCTHSNSPFPKSQTRENYTLNGVFFVHIQSHRTFAMIMITDTMQQPMLFLVAGIVKHFGIQIYLTIYYTFHFWTR